MADFLASWSIFWPAYIGATVLGMTLALVGVAVVARRQVFVAAAASQSSLLGVAVALAVLRWMDASPDPGATAAILGSAATAAGVLAAVAISLAPARSSGPDVGGDEVTALVFLAAAAAATLLLARLPAGMEELRRLQMSSVLAVRPADLIVIVALAAVCIALALVVRRPLGLVLSDRTSAAALGLKPERWDLGLAVVIGVAVGVGVDAAGAVYAFGTLALPCLVAKQLVPTNAAVFLAAPLVALLTAPAGLAAAYALDVPPGQAVVALLAALVVLVALARSLRRRILQKH